MAYESDGPEGCERAAAPAERQGHYVFDDGHCACGEFCGTGTGFQTHLESVRQGAALPPAKPTRNSKELADFVKFCEAHPEQRFWQALRNWTGYGFIVATNEGIHHRDLDTFYWEGRRHDG